MTDLSIEEIIDKFSFVRRKTYGFFEDGTFKEIKFYSLIINEIFFIELNKIKDWKNYKILYVIHDEDSNLVITENKEKFNTYEEAIILINKEEKILKVTLEVRNEKKEIILEKESKGNKMIIT